MKRKALLISVALLLAAGLSFHGCKKADVETGVLKVIVSKGVSGTPASGSYTKNIGDQVPYSFSLEAGYGKLTVLLDGGQVAASGTVTISGNQTLKAYSDENGKYTLTVNVDAGATGTPAAGIYSYAEGSAVPYSYALAQGYTNLSLQLDSTIVPASGSITMTADRVLTVSATSLKNIQGTWALAEVYSDGSSFGVNATFSGDRLHGTVTDSQGGSGTYTYDNTTVKFTLVFPDVTYEYTGSFSEADKMSGTCKRYQASDNIISGSWEATRGAASSAGADKGKFDPR